MIEDLDRELRSIGNTVRCVSDDVSDLVAKTDCIYDAVTRHPESRYDAMSGDGFLDDAEE